MTKERLNEIKEMRIDMANKAEGVSWSYLDECLDAIESLEKENEVEKKRRSNASVAVVIAQERIANLEDLCSRHRKSLEEIKTKIEGGAVHGTPYFQDWKPICLCCDWVHSIARNSLKPTTL